MQDAIRRVSSVQALRSTVLLVICAGWLADAGASARAEGDGAVLRLGFPVVQGQLGTFPVTLEFQSLGAEHLAYFSLDVAASLAPLTDNGLDYSRFSFTAAPAIQASFTRIPAANFSAGPRNSTVQYDALSGTLAPGEYLLGQLLVEFTDSGLAPGEPGSISLAGADSVIGVETIGQPATFRFIDAEFVPYWSAEVPEPAPWVLLGTVLTLWCANRNRTAR